jgi:hypothetical protein
LYSEKLSLKILFAVSCTKNRAHSCKAWFTVLHISLICRQAVHVLLAGSCTMNVHLSHTCAMGEPTHPARSFRRPLLAHLCSVVLGEVCATSLSKTSHSAHGAVQSITFPGSKTSRIRTESSSSYLSHVLGNRRSSVHSHHRFGYRASRILATRHVAAMQAIAQQICCGCTSEAAL